MTTLAKCSKNKGVHVFQEFSGAYQTCLNCQLQLTPELRKLAALETIAASLQTVAKQGEPPERPPIDLEVEQALALLRAVRLLQTNGKDVLLEVTQGSFSAAIIEETGDVYLEVRVGGSFPACICNLAAALQGKSLSTETSEVLAAVLEEDAKR